MVSRFATDFSESEVSCRVLAKGNSLDKFTEELANTICPELQRQLQAGECKKVTIDMRGIQHALMAERTGKKGNEITARQNAVVNLPFRPEALECHIGETKEFRFVSTVYVGKQPNGEQACYNVTIDMLPVVPVLPEVSTVRAIPYEFSTQGTSSSNWWTPRSELPLDYCVPDVVRDMVNRRR